MSISRSIVQIPAPGDIKIVCTFILATNEDFKIRKVLPYLFCSTSFEWQVNPGGAISISGHQTCAGAVEVRIGDAVERFFKLHLNLKVDQENKCLVLRGERERERKNLGRGLEPKTFVFIYNTYFIFILFTKYLP